MRVVLKTKGVLLLLVLYLTAILHLISILSVRLWYKIICLFSVFCIPFSFILTSNSISIYRIDIVEKISTFSIYRDNIY